MKKITFNEIWLLNVSWLRKELEDNYYGEMDSNVYTLLDTILKEYQEIIEERVEKDKQ